MSGELVLQSSFNRPYLLNDKNEDQIKARFLVKPSDEVRLELGKVDINQGVDLCIVLDVSKSMNAFLDKTGAVKTGRFTTDEHGRRVELLSGGKSKLDVAIDAAKNVISMVRNTDNVTCIIYSDNPQVLFKNYSGDKKNLMISEMDKIFKVRTGNNTNISAAIREARTILVANKDIKSKKILFLTDGVPTVDTEADGIREGEYLSEYNISIDCIGLESEFCKKEEDRVNLPYLERIAAPSNGSSNFITQAYEVERLFMNIFEKAKEVIITNAKLRLTFSKAIRLTDHYRGTPENVYLGKVKLDQTRSCIINLGQIERNQGYNYYFNITVPSQEGYSGPLRIAKADLEYNIPALYGNKTISVSQNVSIEIGGNEKLASMKEGNIEIEYMLVNVKKLEREALEARDRNDSPTVVDRYKKIINTYKNLNNTNEARAYEHLLDEYIKTGIISLEALNKATNSSSKATGGGTLEPIDTPSYSMFARVKR